MPGHFVMWLGAMRVRYSYAASLFNMFGLPLVIVKTVQELLSSAGVQLPFLLLLGVGMLVLVVAGYFFDKLGLYEAENTYAVRRNADIRYLVEEAKKRGKEDEERL